MNFGCRDAVLRRGHAGWHARAADPDEPGRRERVNQNDAAAKAGFRLRLCVVVFAAAIVENAIARNVHPFAVENENAADGLALSRTVLRDQVVVDHEVFHVGQRDATEAGGVEQGFGKLSHGPAHVAADVVPEDGQIDAR